MNDTPSTPIRCGMVAIVGRANVGKSTLLNTILEEKVSIVSPVAQTTRNVIRGILTEPRGQLVFLDTPGVHKSDHDLGKVMNRFARSTVEGVDLVLLVVDASLPPVMEDEGWMSRLVRDEIPCVVLLNKADLNQECAQLYRDTWEKACASRQKQHAAEWRAVSALKGEGIPDLLTALFARMQEGPYLFPADVLTDYPRKLAIGDIIREKLFGVLREELPHAVTVWVSEINESEAGWQIEAVVYVNKPSQKGIVIGEKGRLLRKVKRQADAELAAIYERPVDVHLWVKAEKNWSQNFWLLKKFGYVAS